MSSNNHTFSNYSSYDWNNEDDDAGYDDENEIILSAIETDDNVEDEEDYDISSNSSDSDSDSNNSHLNNTNDGDNDDAQLDNISNIRVTLEKNGNTDIDDDDDDNGNGENASLRETQTEKFRRIAENPLRNEDDTIADEFSDQDEYDAFCEFMRVHYGQEIEKRTIIGGDDQASRRNKRRRKRKSAYYDDSSSDSGSDNEYSKSTTNFNTPSNTQPSSGLTDADIATYFHLDKYISVRNNPSATMTELRAALKQMYPVLRMANSITTNIDDEFQQDLATQLYACHLAKRKNMSVVNPCSSLNSLSSSSVSKNGLDMWTSWPFRPDLEQGQEDILAIDEDDVRDLTERPRRVNGLGWKDPINNKTMDLKTSTAEAVKYGEQENGVTDMPSTHIRRKAGRMNMQTDPFDVAQGTYKKTKPLKNKGLLEGNQTSIQLNQELNEKPKIPFSNTNILTSNLRDITQLSSTTASSFDPSNPSSSSSTYYSARKHLGRKNLDYIPPNNATDIYTDPDNPSALPYARIATGTSSLPKNVVNYKISDSMSAYTDFDDEGRKLVFDTLTGEAVGTCGSSNKNGKNSSSNKNAATGKFLNPEIGLPRDTLPELVEKRLAHARQLVLFELNSLFQRKVYDKIQCARKEAQYKRKVMGKNNKHSKNKHQNKRQRQEVGVDVQDGKHSVGAFTSQELKNVSVDKNGSKVSRSLKISSSTPFGRQLHNAVPIISPSPQLSLQVREKLLDLLDTILIQTGYAAHLSAGTNINAKSSNSKSNNSSSSKQSNNSGAGNSIGDGAGLNLVTWAEVVAYSGVATLGDVYKRCHELFFKDLEDPRAEIGKEEEGNGKDVVLANGSSKASTDLQNGTTGGSGSSSSSRFIDADIYRDAFDKDGNPIYDLYNYLFPADFVTPDPEPTSNPSSSPSPSSASNPIRGNLSAAQIQALHLSTQFIDPSSHFGNSEAPLSQYKSVLADVTAVPGAAGMRSVFECGNSGRGSGGGTGGGSNEGLGRRGGMAGGLNTFGPAGKDYLLGSYGLGKEYFQHANTFGNRTRSGSKHINENGNEKEGGEEEQNLDQNDPQQLNPSRSQSRSQTPTQLNSKTTTTTTMPDPKLDQSPNFHLFQTSKLRSRQRALLVSKLRKHHVMHALDRDIVTQGKRLRGLRNAIAFQKGIWRKVGSLKEQGVIGHGFTSHGDKSDVKLLPDWVIRGPRNVTNKNDTNDDDDGEGNGDEDDKDSEKKLEDSATVPPVVPGWLTASKPLYPVYISETLRRMEDGKLPLGSYPEAEDGNIGVESGKKLTQQSVVGTNEGLIATTNAQYLLESQKFQNSSKPDFNPESGSDVGSNADVDLEKEDIHIDLEKDIDMDPDIDMDLDIDLDLQNDPDLELSVSASQQLAQKMKRDKLRANLLTQKSKVRVVPGYRPDLAAKVYDPRNKSSGKDFGNGGRLAGGYSGKYTGEPARNFLFAQVQRALTESGDGCNYELLLDTENSNDDRRTGVRSNNASTSSSSDKSRKRHRAYVDRVPIAGSGGKSVTTTTSSSSSSAGSAASTVTKYWGGVDGLSPPKMSNFANVSTKTGRKERKKRNNTEAAFYHYDQNEEKIDYSNDVDVERDTIPATLIATTNNVITNNPAINPTAGDYNEEEEEEVVPSPLPLSTSASDTNSAYNLQSLNGPGPLDPDLAYYGTFMHTHHGRKFVGVDDPYNPMTSLQRRNLPELRKLYVIGYNLNRASTGTASTSSTTAAGTTVPTTSATSTNTASSVHKSKELTSEFVNKYQSLRYVLEGPDVPGMPKVASECMGGLLQNQDKLGLVEKFNAFESEWEDCSEEEDNEQE